MKKNSLDGYIGEEVRNPVKAIRRHCMECVCGSPYAIESCSAYSCLLYPFRFGTNPYRSSKELSEDEKNELVKRLKEAKNKQAVSDD